MRPLLLGALLLVAGCSAPSTPWPRPGRETQSASTTALLQAVSAVNGDVVWVSGQRGTWARSLDGGRSWQTGTVAGGETLQFRDVHAQSADTAWLLSSGNGALSRIYHTTDGGQTWALQFQNADSAAFYDCMDFWDGTRGLVFGDEVQGRMMVLQTSDGEHWSLIPKERLPAALPGEGGFAASVRGSPPATARRRGWCIPPITGKAGPWTPTRSRRARRPAPRRSPSRTCAPPRSWAGPSLMRTP
jgi:photosystem II stability/assembly factor-like uncharacterized protein